MFSVAVLLEVAAERPFLRMCDQATRHDSTSVLEERTHVNRYFEMGAGSMFAAFALVKSLSKRESFRSGFKTSSVRMN
jgi:hypothetical protein